MKKVTGGRKAILGEKNVGSCGRASGVFELALLRSRWRHIRRKRTGRSGQVVGDGDSPCLQRSTALGDNMLATRGPTRGRSLFKSVGLDATS